MYPHDVFALRSQFVLTRREFLASGCTPQGIAHEVHTARILRIRRGNYALPDTAASIVEANRVGGRVTCISAARLLGIWVVDDARVHVSLRHEASRLRNPTDRFLQLDEVGRQKCQLHWWPLIVASDARAHSVGKLDVLAHLIRCQPTRFAIAALDSALQQRIIDIEDIEIIFAGLPAKYLPLMHSLDGKCMSGLETLFRLMAQHAKLTCVSQVFFRGIGTVDFVVDGCIVIETDGRLGHDDPVSRARDFARDAALAALGYTVLRFNYEQVMFRPDEVMAAVRGALRTHRSSTAARR